MAKKITDAEIMSNVLEELNTSANSFAKKIDVTAGTVYHILNGINSLSENLKARIIRSYPRVSYNYLSRAELPIIQDKSITQSMQNILGGEQTLRKPGFDDIPKLLIDMNKKLDTLIEVLSKEK